MASRFVLTAQVQLQAPTNTRQVVNQIQRQLSGVNMQVNLQGGQQAAKQVNNLGKATKQATTQATKMGKAFGASIRRFGAFTIATRAVSLFSNSLANATKDAIDFQREMIKISQVTGKTMAQLKGLENTITELATSLGVSSKSILSVGRILSQAGIQAKDLEVALKALAKTELAPTFDDITKTAEGAVAILAQFGEGVGALERQLGAINAVAGQFAVESGDLISAVRRTGGVFKAAGGDLEELLALFTSVRATTRESAESIATGLRTIFTRIQRPATIEFLKQFGVELTDLNGKFVGPYEAIRQLSTALSGLQEGDIRFVRIAEELGGFRQIGKVIPLLQQFETAERARQAALEGGNSLNDDAAKAQAALAVQITKVKEETKFSFNKVQALKQIDLNWIKGINPIYSVSLTELFKHPGRTLCYYTTDEESDFYEGEHISIIVKSISEGKDLIDFIINQNGENVSFMNIDNDRIIHKLGYLFDISLVEPENFDFPIVEINRRKKLDYTSAREEEILHGIHVKSDLIKSRIKGFKKLILNNGELVADGRYTSDANAQKIDSWHSDFSTAFNDVNQVLESNDPANEFLKLNIEEAKNKIIDSGFSYKTENFEMNFYKGNSSWWVNFNLN